LKIGLTPEKTGKKGVLCWSGCEPSTPQSRKGTDDTVTDGRRSRVKKLQLQALLPKLQLHLLPKLWLHLKWLQPLPSTPTGCRGPGHSQLRSVLTQTSQVVRTCGKLNKDGFFQALLGKWNKKQAVNDGLGRIFPLDQHFS